MGIDIGNSRAGYNVRCRWWKRNENDEIDNSELIYKRVADGMFMAKETAPLNTQNISVGGVFRFERDSLTIKSPDDLSNISSEDIVEFNNELWIVNSVQRSKSRVQNTFFGKDEYCSHFWYLELRK